MFEEPASIGLRKTGMIMTCKSILAFAPLFLFGLAACSLAVSSDADAGGQNHLQPCPHSPNCVSSLDSEESHFVAPLGYTGSREAAYQALVSIIEAEPRARIVSRQENYLHAEFKSRVFGFVDDVEFLFSSDLPIIQVRSASRMGYYDFGVNRKRIEGLRRLLSERLNP